MMKHEKCFYGYITCHSLTFWDNLQFHWHSGKTEFSRNKLFRLRGIHIGTWTLPFFYYSI